MAIRIEKTCQRCSATFVVNRNSLAAVQKFCGRACANAALRNDSMKSRYRTVQLDVSHPIASRSGKALEHRLILWGKIGPGIHPCHHCCKAVTWTTRQYVTKNGLVADHLDGNTHNNDPSNLVASCQRCNIKKRHDRVQDDEPFIQASKGARCRGEERSCQHCAGRFVTFPSTDPRHPGLYCSRACVAAAKRKASTRACAHCGIEFYKPGPDKYCGRPCYYAAHRGRPRKRRVALET